MSLVTTDSQTLSVPSNCPSRVLDLRQAVLDLWQTVARNPFHSYRPERHYMRGRGPKARGPSNPRGAPFSMVFDLRAKRFDGLSGVSAWLRGIGVRQVRLACGLVMFSYIFSHFFNHALGNISYATMEAWLWFHIWWWRIPIVNVTLYAAAVTHFSLGLWALYQRRHFRYAVAEITQLLLGLSIPVCTEN
jgi:hypothetical protein